ncbi:MAG TPA: hypothetical protein ENO18_03165 [Caldithrix sp.]|nr:hypothetical protein [Caldithrix sp.]
MRFAVMVALCILLQFCGSKEMLPQDLLGYSLVDRTVGTEAQKIVNKIHLKPVTDTPNEIGYYQKGDDKAIIYITNYSSDDDAQADLIKMVDKISPQNSVFLNGGQVEINKITAHRYFGMGQTHFIFRVDNILVWLSVDTMIANEFLESYLQKIN